MISKILITLGTIVYGVLPPLADLTPTHVGHPDWTPHSKVHMVWLLATGSSIAVVSLYLLWVKKQTVLAAVLGMCVLGGFWVAAATKDLYGGAFTDIGGIDSKILGLDANAFVFGVGVLLVVSGLVFRKRTDGA